MKILDVKSLAIPDVKVIRFGRFGDHRGFFAEHFRKSDFMGHPQLDFMAGVEFSQCNESFSRPGTIRGLHFQWNPYMGKLVRTLSGRMTDMVLDIRKGSPTFGKIILYDMPAAKRCGFRGVDLAPSRDLRMAIISERIRTSSTSVQASTAPAARPASLRWPPISTGRSATRS